MIEVEIKYLKNDRRAFLCFFALTDFHRNTEAVGYIHMRLISNDICLFLSCDNIGAPRLADILILYQSFIFYNTVCNIHILFF